jgi:Flp pilus assembly CpaF family ATPase
MPVERVSPQNERSAIHAFAIEVIIQMHDTSSGSLSGLSVIEFIGMEGQHPQVGHTATLRDRPP